MKRKIHVKIKTFIQQRAHQGEASGATRLRPSPDRPPFPSSGAPAPAPLSRTTPPSPAPYPSDPDQPPPSPAPYPFDSDPPPPSSALLAAPPSPRCHHPQSHPPPPESFPHGPVPASLRASASCSRSPPPPSNLLRYISQRRSDTSPPSPQPRPRHPLGLHS